MLANALPDTQSKSAAKVLLDWYDRHARKLPWRALPGEPADPYRVWLSEIMLQQTTVQAVKPYFEAFTARWPTVGELAASPVEEVMSRWAGLGYYSRARNLHACACIVAERHGGRFPDDEAALLALPGVGAYTAAAIASIAFGRRAVVVDGNVERVISRLFEIAEPLPSSKPRIRAFADGLTPDLRPGDFAQAMMDLGATICTPRKPACALCPFSEQCLGRKGGVPETYPRKSPKPERPTRRGAAFVVVRADGAVLVRTRPPKGLLGSMLETPGTEWRVNVALPLEPSGPPFSGNWQRAPQPVRHVFTHFPLELSVFRLDVGETTAAPQGMVWLPAAGIGQAALPTVFRKVLEAAGAGFR
ncbi:MAG: A/G-specific adenine glycosylase [Beijerinckiaceae bacterium]